MGRYKTGERPERKIICKCVYEDYSEEEKKVARERVMKEMALYYIGIMIKEEFDKLEIVNPAI